MQHGQPGQTARGAAAHRAIHQILEGGAIFKDPFASRILDERTAASLNQMAADESPGPMRLSVAVRSRFSEDALAVCVARGVRQIVILGAGLDTFYRAGRERMPTRWGLLISRRLGAAAV
jgi:methyltransferase (TIGR00027 family)